MAKKRASESFRKVRKQNKPTSESFGTLPYVSEKTSEHVLSVRDVAKRFENAGVPRTERSIINWCQPNPQGIPRLDCFFDTNERKYFITPVSVDRAISEERNKLKIQDQSAPSETDRNPSENSGGDSESFGNHPDSFGTLPKSAEGFRQDSPSSQSRELEVQMRDLQIMNKAKDMYIERLETSNDKLIEELKHASHQLGALQTQVRRLQGPGEQESPPRKTQASTADEPADQTAPVQDGKPETGRTEAMSQEPDQEDENRDERLRPIDAETSDQQQPTDPEPPEPEAAV